MNKGLPTATPWMSAILVTLAQPACSSSDNQLESGRVAGANATVVGGRAASGIVTSGNLGFGDTQRIGDTASGASLSNGGAASGIHGTLGGTAANSTAHTDSSSSVFGGATTG